MKYAFFAIITPIPIKNMINYLKLHRQLINDQRNFILIAKNLTLFLFYLSCIGPIANAACHAVRSDQKIYQEYKR